MSTQPRFLCDEMLGQLCRYLRAAGYDALLACGGRKDNELLRQCHAEGRYFLTQDKLVIEHKSACNVALILPQGDLDKFAALLGAYLNLDWLDRAFTRCLLDNTPLEAANAEAALRAPKLKPDEPLCHCPTCGRIYWRGSHYQRMRARLAAWQASRQRGLATSQII